MLIFSHDVRRRRRRDRIYPLRDFTPRRVWFNHRWWFHTQPYMLLYSMKTAGTKKTSEKERWRGDHYSHTHISLFGIHQEKGVQQLSIKKKRATAAVHRYANDRTIKWALELGSSSSALCVALFHYNMDKVMAVVRNRQEVVHNTPFFFIIACFSLLLHFSLVERISPSFLTRHLVAPGGGRYYCSMGWMVLLLYLFIIYKNRRSFFQKTKRKNKDFLYLYQHAMWILWWIKRDERRFLSFLLFKREKSF